MHLSVLQMPRKLSTWNEASFGRELTTTLKPCMRQPAKPNPVSRQSSRPLSRELGLQVKMMQRLILTLVANLSMVAELLLASSSRCCVYMLLRLNPFFCSRCFRPILPRTTFVTLVKLSRGKLAMMAATVVK